MVEKVEIFKMNKEELNQIILASRARLVASVGLVSEERMDRVILHGEWSVKDLIGHLAFWEQRVVTLFELLQAGTIPGTMEDLHKLNEQAIQEYRNLTLVKVREIEQQAYLNVLGLVENASEAELFEPTHFGWTEGRCFYEFIADNTCGHFDEHLPELVGWQKRIA